MASGVVRLPSAVADAVDRAQVGFRRGESVLVVGGPGSGKSWVARTVCVAHSGASPVTLVVEGSRQQHRARALLDATGDTRAAAVEVIAYADLDHLQSDGLIVYDGADAYDPPPPEAHPRALSVMYCGPRGFDSQSTTMHTTTVIALDGWVRLAPSTIGVLRRATVLPLSQHDLPRLAPNDSEAWEDKAAAIMRRESIALVALGDVSRSSAAALAFGAANAFLRDAHPLLTGSHGLRTDLVSHKLTAAVIDATSQTVRQRGARAHETPFDGIIDQLPWNETAGLEYTATVVVTDAAAMSDQDIAETALTRHAHACLILMTGSFDIRLASVLASDGRAWQW